MPATVVELRPPADATYDRAFRAVVVAALAYAVAAPLIDALLVVVYGDGGRTTLWVVLATGCYLPLHLRHVWFGLKARRPPAGVWTLLAMAVVVAGALPLAGPSWPRALGALGASTLIVLRPPWSWALWGAIVLAALPAALLFSDKLSDSYWHATTVLARSLILFALVWLASALHRLRSSREVLAQQVLARERRRIDRELEETVGAALESIIDHGRRADTAVGSRDADATRALSALVEESREALARARTMVRGYQQVPLRVELDTAVRLLHAAGIDASLRLPRDGVADEYLPTVRRELRAMTAQLLGTPRALSCVLTVTSDGRLHLEMGEEQASPAAGAVAVR